MTTTQLKQRLDEMESSDERSARIVFAACCLVITLAWMALLAEVLL